jgi:hypothetical protein
MPDDNSEHPAYSRQMHKVLLLVLAVGLAPIAAAAAPERSEGLTTLPALRLAGVHPVKLRGLGFQPSERIRVTAASKGVRQHRSVRASSRGSFVTTFAELPYDRCSALFAVAVGASGKRAALKLPEPACPPRL